MKTILILSGLSLLTLVSEILNFKKIILSLILIGLAVAFVVNLQDWNTNISYYNNMIRVDNFAVAFSGILIFITFLWFIHSEYYFRDRFDTKSDKYSLILFSLIGGVVLTSYSNLVMLFLGIEILSIPVYILAGSRKTELASNEAAMKYFLMGAFATGILLFGVALVYGVSGTFHLEGISKYLSESATIDSIFYIGAGMMIIGLAFKVSAVPFHFWTPDVYQGAPTIITTFMASVVKTAAFAALLRLFIHSFSSVSAQFSTALAVMAALTILVGNITAVYQDNIKRMLAYSSIAHAGYMLLALVSLNQLSASSIMLYAVAYSINTIASFTVLYIILKDKGSDDLTAFRGLAKSNPLITVITIISMLSLAGIPPTAGFFAKYYIFSAAIAEGHVVLVLIAVLGSLIGVYYYFKVIIAMFQPATIDEKLSTTGGFNILLMLTTLIVVLLGIFPNLFIGLV